MASSDAPYFLRARGRRFEIRRADGTLESFSTAIKNNDELERLIAIAEREECTIQVVARGPVVYLDDLLRHWRSMYHGANTAVFEKRVDALTRTGPVDPGTEMHHYHPLKR